MKKKRHKTTQKPRASYHYATTGVVTSFELNVDPSTGDLTFPEAESGSLRTSAEYKRESGKDKITTLVPVKKQNIFHDVTRSVISNYDHLVAIDTNSKIISGIRFAVTTIYHIKQCIQNYKLEIPIDHLRTYLIKAPKDTVNPETIGWNLFFNNLYNADYFHRTNRRLGVIVDSELGQHPAFNGREIPYYLQSYLPTNAILIYASADTSADTLPNAMVRLCDQMSARVLSYIETNRLTLPPVCNGDVNFEGYWFIDPKLPCPASEIKKFNFK